MSLKLILSLLLSLLTTALFLWYYKSKQMDFVCDYAYARARER